MLYLPAAVLGGGLGYLLFKKLDVRLFYRMILFALLAIGILLVFL